MPRKPFTKAGPGRPKGRQNDATIEVKALARALVDDPAYRAKLKTRLHAGKLAPAVETMLWHYAHGVPKAAVSVENPDGSALAFTINIARPDADV